MDTWDDRLTQAFGDAAKRSGVLTELAGRIFGALYLSPDPLSLDDICERLEASKGNVSVQVRHLLAIGMVRRASVRPGRRHYYDAVTDLWPIATELIGRRLEQEAETLLQTLRSLERARPARRKKNSTVDARLASLQLFLQTAIGMVGAFRRGEQLQPDGLRKAGS